MNKLPCIIAIVCSNTYNPFEIVLANNRFSAMANPSKQKIVENKRERLVLHFAYCNSELTPCTPLGTYDHLNDHSKEFSKIAYFLILIIKNQLLST